MTIENHRHSFCAVAWDKPHLSDSTIRVLKLPLSHYKRDWFKGRLCDACDALILTTADTSVLQQTISSGFLTTELTPDHTGKNQTGIIVDFSLITNEKERGFK